MFYINDLLKIIFINSILINLKVDVLKVICPCLQVNKRENHSQKFWIIQTLKNILRLKTGS